MRFADAVRAARYPAAAQRGLRIFIGEAGCTNCHLGPLFTNGEFGDVGIPFFVKSGGVDSGRHGGIGRLQESPFNRLGKYSDEELANWQTLAKACQGEGADALELNLSCPHMDRQDMGSNIGKDTVLISTVTQAVKEVARVPIWAKRHGAFA